MVTPLTSQYAARIKDRAFAGFEALTGHEPRTLKQKVLALLMYDWDWWPMFNMVLVLNQATSIDQRINEMEREGGIVFDRRHFGSAHWQWKLATALDRINFAKCELKEPVKGRDESPDYSTRPIGAYALAGSKDSKPLGPSVPISLQPQDSQTQTGDPNKIQMEIGI